MGKTVWKSGRVETALGALVADGCLSVAFTAHLLANGGATLALADYLVMALILAVLLTACWVICLEYWSANGESADSVKRLRIKELKEGAAIEFDGRSYRVDNINRGKGEILIARVGSPGRIIVQIEGES
ncbi:hypothetical protein [Geomonas sp.]|uniref:hypothetical protein n=1 Tax=Geomonas sp. TaxID=2651584 RepID=UPI002B4A8034|nr:hypothetical protein [Geomonas sp.]HJV34434.1 hypothetical protein [Geomonas sp.]